MLSRWDYLIEKKLFTGLIITGAIIEVDNQKQES